MPHTPIEHYIYQQLVQCLFLSNQYRQALLLNKPKQALCHSQTLHQRLVQLQQEALKFAEEHPQFIVVRYCDLICQLKNQPLIPIDTGHPYKIIDQWQRPIHDLMHLMHKRI